jgi:hypothetical protein
MKNLRLEPSQKIDFIVIMFRRINLLILSIAFLVSCASTYKGPKPDFSKTGDAAQEEIKKYSFEEDYWTQGYFYRMGPDRQALTLGSLRPVIESTSTSATELLDKGEKWHQAALVGIGVAIVSIVGASMSHNHSVQNPLYGVSIAGSAFSLTSSFISAAKLKDGAVQFNKDLRSKFNPKITYNWKF